MKNTILKVSIWTIVFLAGDNTYASKYDFLLNDQPCFIKGLIGEQPETLCMMKRFIERVTEIGKIENAQERTKNENLAGGDAYMLWGPPGIGKTKALEAIARETGALIRVYSATDLNRQMEEAQDANRIMVDIYREIKELTLRERRPVMLVFDQLDKVLEKNPRFIGEISGVLKGEIDEHSNRISGNNPYLITVIVGNSRFHEFDGSVHRRFFFIEWKHLTLSERAAMIAQFDPSISSLRAKLLALVTSNFTGGELEKLVHEAQKLKDGRVKFPLMHSYWQETSMEKQGHCFTGVALYSALFLTLFFNRDRITGFIKHFIKNENGKEKTL